MTIKGLLFDKDGTLLDFHLTWIPVNRLVVQALTGGDPELSDRLLEAAGHDPRTNQVRPGTLLAVGNSAQIAARWAEFLPGREVGALAAEIDRLFAAGGETHAVPVTELAPLFARLKERGLKLGVATSDSLQGIRASLAPFGILELLDFLAGHDSGHGIKPQPGMVRAFCAAIGLAPAEVAVIGDNLHDLEMGRRAGAGLLVGVLSGTGVRPELARHADHVIDSVEELEALLDRVE
jgi:phosphoglycolate phosphatase